MLGSRHVGLLRGGFCVFDVINTIASVNSSVAIPLLSSVIYVNYNYNEITITM